MDIQQHGYPKFWLNIRRDFNKDKINYKLSCPMNMLSEIKFPEFAMKKGVLPMSYFYNQYQLDGNRRKSKKVEGLIEKYALGLYVSHMNNDDEYFLLRSDFEDMVEDIRQMYISKEYLGLMSWLVNRAFCITPNMQAQSRVIQSKINKNKSILLKTLYSVNPNNLLEIFSKNI